MTKDLSGYSLGVIGLGNMGSALAKALLSANAQLTVWNRSADKADALAAEDAQTAANPAELAATGDIIIICVTDHAATSEILNSSGMGDALKGKILCQLGVVSADQSRDTGAWTDERGIDYLEASILGVPATVADQTAMLVCSAPDEIYQRCEELFTAFGGSMLVTETRGGAYDFDKAVYSFSYSVIQGFLHGMALAHANGMSLEAYSKLIIKRVPIVWPGVLKGLADAVLTRSHPPDNCEITVWADAFAKNLELSRASGVDDTLPTAIMKNFDTAIAAGYGNQEISALFEAMIAED